MFRSRNLGTLATLALWTTLSACGVVSEDTKKVIDSSVDAALAAKGYLDANEAFAAFQDEAGARAKAGFLDGSDRYAAFMAKPTPSSIATLAEAKAWLHQGCIDLQMADYAFGDTQLHSGNASVSLDEPVMHSYQMLYDMSLKLITDAFIVTDQLPEADRATFHQGDVITYPAEVVADAQKRGYEILDKLPCEIATAGDRAEANMKFFLDGLDPNSVVYKPRLSPELKAKGAGGAAKAQEAAALAKRSRDLAFGM